MGDGFDDPIEERFQFETAAGSGATGEVFRGVDRATGERVAIKRLIANAADATGIARFHREAQLLAQIESPYVVRYIAQGRDRDGRLCLVLEWLGGPDLARLQRMRPLSVAEVVAVVRQAALGLHALHVAGIVHRDVKPANFVTLSDATENTRIKLVDLGIARTPTEASLLTQEGFAVGTLSYMSPEQIRCERTLTPQSDIFSLGVTLYELLSGVRPFRDRDPNALFAKILLHDPPPLRARVPALSQALEDAVHRAIAKSPGDRFESARAMADELGAIPAYETAGEPSATKPIPAPGGTARTSVTVDREQRAVTALFAGFASTASETEVAAFRAVVESHRGKFHPLLGSRAIGIFGEDALRGDEARWAARAALSVREQIGSARIAVATCRLEVGRSGLSEQAIESAVDQLTRAHGAILVDATTARLLDAAFRVDERGADHVLVSERAVEAYAPARLLGRETTTVGRDREIRTLDALLDECVSESASRAVVFTGVAGVGKSRLRHEWLRRLETREERVEVLMARCDPVRAGSALSLATQIIRSAARTIDTDPPDVTQRKVLERVARHVAAEDVPRVASFFCEMLGVPGPDAEGARIGSARSDAMVMASQLKRAWVDWLAAECASNTVVIIIEDLHWGDLPSIKLVEEALSELDQRPLLAVAFARPEVHEAFPKLWAKARTSEIPVEALSRKAAERLVREVLRDTIGADAATRIIDRAAGNAFYLEELIRATADGKLDTLPESVLHMVQARLAKLSSTARRALRVASVFGESFWMGALAAPLGDESGSATLTDVLNDLLADELIVRRGTSRFASEGEFAFRHALLREGAYATLTDDDRVLTHRAAAQWLERMGETDAMVLAVHYERGGERALATRWYARAAQRALAGNDLDAAVARAERGIALGAADAELGALRLIQGEAQRWRGDLRAAQQMLLEALVWLPRATAGWFTAVRLIADLSVPLGRHEWVEELSEEIEALPPETTRDPLCAGATARLAFALLHLARPANRMLDRVAGRVPEFETSAPLVASYIQAAETRRAMIAGNLGGWLEGMQRLAGLAEHAGDVRIALASRNNVGYMRFHCGDYAGAEAILADVLRRATAAGLRSLVTSCQLILGLAIAQQGRVDEGRTHETAAADAYHVGGTPLGEGTARQCLARIALMAGDLECAEREARAAVALHGSAPHHRSSSLAVLAHVLLVAGRASEALEPARESVSILSTMVHWDEHEVFTRWVQAEVFAATGNLEQADAAMAKARSVVVATARTIADRELRQSYLGAAEHAAVLASPLGASVAPPPSVEP